MKTSLDLPDDLYRRVKSKSALEGRAVREVATALFTAWVNGRVPAESARAPESVTGANASDPTQEWLDKWRELGASVTQTDGVQKGLIDQLRRDRK